MCFSATASFGAGIIILGVGAECLRRSTTIPQKILSCIPIIFAVQQFAEGVLWLSLSHASAAYWTKTATYTFLVLAEAGWPIVMPLSIMLLEKNPVKKKIMAVALGLASIMSAGLLYCIIVYKVEANISCSHILYTVGYPSSGFDFEIFYFIITLIPPVISSIKRIQLLGVVIAVAYLITRIFYKDYLISVWCFFAALLSIIVLTAVIQLNRPPKQQQRMFAV